MLIDILWNKCYITDSKRLHYFNYYINRQEVYINLHIKTSTINNYHK